MDAIADFFAKEWVVFWTIPVFTAVVGWLINWTGLIMLFNPVRLYGLTVPGLAELARLLPRKLQEIPGLLYGKLGWQGIVPARAAKMGSIAVDKVIAKIGTPADFYQQLDPPAIAEHIVPEITRAAERAGRPAPRIIAGVAAVVTGGSDDVVAAAREAAATQTAFYDRVPSYRRIVELSGARRVADLVVIGDEETVAAELRRYFDAGATELLITRRTSAVAVCCSSASRVSLNRRAFWIAITA